MHQPASESALLVSALYIYPIKSLGGMAVPQADVLLKGLAYDRRWMLIDDQQRFLTQREHPVLALFKLEWRADGFTVHFAGDAQGIPLNPAGQSIRAAVWDDEVEVYEVDHAISAWFSEKINRPCKLVYFPEEYGRQIDMDYASQNQHTSLSDGFPVLIIGQASLDDLNAKLDKGNPVGMDRFRPNIVFTGALPFEEDSWQTFVINEVEFLAVKPCARCVMTTIDQESGEKGIEPLRTLSGYRKFGNKVLFGQNVIPLSTGNIRTGDGIHLKT